MPRVSFLCTAAVLCAASVAAPTLPALHAQSPIPVAEELNALHFRSIGPATMSGRIADVAVYEANPAIWYVATAHGGLWKTTSNGVTWSPMLQDHGLMSFGDVTISQQNPDLVWAGGGESNNRQSTSWGSGVWKSEDGGATWTHMGLAASKHIHRIVIDPADNNVVLVAATGPLFGSGGERGVYKTTDGGRTWRMVLGGGEDTGANDIVMSASDPRVLFASLYQRRRSACCMNGGGPESALYKSVDGGERWTKVAGGGYPSGELGRIAVDIARTNPDVVYSLVEAAVAPDGDTGLWRSNDGGTTWTKMNGVNPRPMYFSKVLVDPTDPETVYYGGVGLHMSLDGGKNVERDAALATHDDIHTIWVNPRNPQHVIIGNDGGMAASYDQAKSWQFIPNLPVGLFYHVSFDMETPFNICGGMQDNYNWCGPSRSRFARGIQNHDWFQILGGDGFHAIPDPRDARFVYTESQNGNMIRRNVVTGESKSIRPTPLNVSPKPDSGEVYRWQWDAPMLVSSHDPGVLLVAANKVFRSTDRGDSWTVISPDLTRNGNRDTIRTMGVLGKDIAIARNDGVSFWPAIVALGESPSHAGVLWAGTDDGTVSLTRDFGRSWTDVTSRMPGFPAGAFVGEVVPSRFEAGRAYVVVPNYRQNDYSPYVWATENFGTSFRRIDAGLAGEVVRTLTEDPRNADVLYVGTETGLFVSIDRGATWRRFKSNLPDVRVDEIAIHPRDNAMIVGTHGRAIFVLDDLAPVQELATARASAKSVSLFTPTRALQWKYLDNRNDEFWGHQWFSGENPPAEAVLQFHVARAPDSLTVRIARGNRVVRELVVPEGKRAIGIQTVCWDMRAEPIPAMQTGGGGGGGGFGGQNAPRPVPGVRAPIPEAGFRARDLCAVEGQGGFGGGANAGPYLAPGAYTVSLVADGQVVDSKPLTIVMDPEVRFTAQERAAYDRVVMELHEEHRKAAAVVARLSTLRLQLGQVDAKLDSVTGMPTADREAYDALRAAYNALRPSFGLAAPAVGGATGGAGGGGGGGFGAVNAANIYGRFTQLKSGIANVWETPSAGTLAQVRTSRQDLARVLGEATALLDRATRVGRALQPYGLTLAP